LDRMNAVISVSNEERGSERRMQRICLKMPKQEQTSWVMWVYNIDYEQSSTMSWLN